MTKNRLPNHMHLLQKLFLFWFSPTGLCHRHFSYSRGQWKWIKCIYSTKIFIHSNNNAWCISYAEQSKTGRCIIIAAFILCFRFCH